MKKALAKNPELGGAAADILYSDLRNIGGIKSPIQDNSKDDGSNLGLLHCGTRRHQQGDCGLAI